MTQSERSSAAWYKTTMEFALKVDDSKLQNAASTLRQKLGDWSAAWPEVADAIRALVRAQFDTQGMGTWAPLSRRYAALKAKRYPGKPLLRVTDGLFNSLTGESSDGVFQSSSDRLTVGTSLGYAVYHQAVSRSTKLPRRPIFDVSVGSSSFDVIAQPLDGLAREMARATGFVAVGASESTDGGSLAPGGAAALTGDVVSLREGM